MTNRLINRSHPQAQGLVGFWPCNAVPGRTNDPYNLKSTTKTGSVSLASSPIGPAFLYDGTGSSTGIIDTQTRLSDISGNNWTLHSQCFITSRLVSSCLFYNYVDSFSGCFLIVHNSNNNADFRIWKSGNSYQVVSNGDINLNTAYSITATCSYDAGSNTTTLALYVNGIKQTGTASFAGTYNDSSSTMKLGNSNAISSAICGYQNRVRIYNRALPLKEIQELHSNPDAIYQKRKLIRVMPSVAASVNTSNFFQMF